MRHRSLIAITATMMLLFTACGGDDSGSLEASLREAQQGSGSDDLSDLFGEDTDLEDLFGGEGMEDLFGGEGMEDLFGGEGMDDLFGGGDMEGMDDLLGGMFGGECMEFYFSFLGLMMGSAFLFMGADDEQLAELRDQSRELVASAPSEIRDDVTVVAEAMASHFDEVGNTPMNQMDELDDPFDDPAVEQAGENIEAWLDANCGDDPMFGDGDFEDMFGN
jgi:hypothetical protein